MYADKDGEQGMGGYHLNKPSESPANLMIGFYKGESLKVTSFTPV